MITPTPDWYSANAAPFCAQTFAIDMEPARQRFLRYALAISLKYSESNDPTHAPDVDRTLRFRTPEEASRSIHAIGMLRLIEDWTDEGGPPRHTRWIHVISRRAQ